MRNTIGKAIIGLFVLIFGIGCALTANAADRGTADDAVAMVKKAAEYVKKNGKDKAFAEFNDPKGQFIEKDLYIFAFSTNGDGIERANGGNQKVVGKNVIDMRDADGQYFIKNILAVANSKTGKEWVNYKWTDPITKLIQPKKAYIEKVGDVLLGCGIYEN